MKSGIAPLWGREYLDGYALIGVGLFTLTGMMILLIPNLDLFLENPGTIFGLLLPIFAILALMIAGGLFMFFVMRGKVSRLFPSRHDETRQIVSNMLKRLAIAFVLRQTVIRPYALLRPKSVFDIADLGIKIEICGPDKTSSVLGPLSRVYVGRISKKNRDEVRTLLEEFNRAFKPSKSGSGESS